EKASQHHGLNSLASQNEIEVGAGKGVKTALAFDNDVFGVRFQHVDDCSAPRSLAEGFVVDDALQNSVGVRGQFAVTLGKADRRMHDGGARGTTLVRDFHRVGEHVVRLHDVFDPVMKNATHRRKVV